MRSAKPAAFSFKDKNDFMWRAVQQVATGSGSKVAASREPGVRDRQHRRLRGQHPPGLCPAWPEVMLPFSRTLCPLCPQGMGPVSSHLPHRSLSVIRLASRSQWTPGAGPICTLLGDPGAPRGQRKC